MSFVKIINLSSIGIDISLKFEKKGDLSKKETFPRVKFDQQSNTTRLTNPVVDWSNILSDENDRQIVCQRVLAGPDFDTACLDNSYDGKLECRLTPVFYYSSLFNAYLWFWVGQKYIDEQYRPWDGYYERTTSNVPNHMTDLNKTYPEILNGIDTASTIVYAVRRPTGLRETESNVLDSKTVCKVYHKFDLVISSTGLVDKSTLTLGKLTKAIPIIALPDYAGHFKPTDLDLN